MGKGKPRTESGTSSQRRVNIDQQLREEIQEAAGLVGDLHRATAALRTAKALSEQQEKELKELISSAAAKGVEEFHGLVELKVAAFVDSILAERMQTFTEVAQEYFADLAGRAGDAIGELNRLKQELKTALGKVTIFVGPTKTAGYATIAKTCDKCGNSAWFTVKQLALMARYRELGRELEGRCAACVDGQMLTGPVVITDVENAKP